jgi:hypothetical protein
MFDYGGLFRLGFGQLPAGGGKTGKASERAKKIGRFWIFLPAKICLRGLACADETGKAGKKLSVPQREFGTQENRGKSWPA